LFLLSGASALIFESLWFYQATLVFGNTVWASSIVLASFMAGLTLGNGLAAKFQHRLARPLRLYALLEMTIAITGVGLVALFPHLPALFAPLFGALSGSLVASEMLRVASAFCLMVIPSTAMGMTLPILVRVLTQTDPVFGSVLGRLYGWNTFGAVLGVLLAEITLIPYLGVLGSAALAGAINVLVALGAWSLLKNATTSIAQPTPIGPVTQSARWLLVVAFLSGAALLALEVIWFRFLLLFLNATYLAFAAMLAVVLAGIGTGGLAASRWCRRQPGADQYLVVVFLLTGAILALSYKALTPSVADTILGSATRLGHALVMSLLLMFPVSFMSGVIFTLLGNRLHRSLPNDVGAAGFLTLANTAGSILGALLAGFLLLPHLGVERSLFAVTLAYGAGAVLLTGNTTTSKRLPPLTAAIAYVLALMLFPFDAFERHLDAVVSRVIKSSHSSVVARAEGLNQTIQLVRSDSYGRPLSYKLITNGHSMSDSNPAARRYMKQYVYWPVAVHGHVRSALLISYGLGVTAKAITDTREIERIAIVDPSREILSLSKHRFPNDTENPTLDERVEVHREDGRHFLHTNAERFDLITGEPPPPTHAGIVSLYTREYFELTRARLNDGGVITYWLPVIQMRVAAAQSIIRAFCEVYEDCSLWAGSGFNLMLVGTNGLTTAPAQTRFEHQWKEPHVRTELVGVGFETPGQLAATFVADAEQLKLMTAGVEPLTDNYPRRLDYRRKGSEGRPTYSDWLNPLKTETRFRESHWIAQMLPEGVREESYSFFAYQSVLNYKPTVTNSRELALLTAVLDRTRLVTPVHWLLGSSDQDQRNLTVDVAAGYRQEHAYGLAVQALGERDYKRAQHYLAELKDAGTFRTTVLQVISLCKLGKSQRAQEIAKTYRERTGSTVVVRC